MAAKAGDTVRVHYTGTLDDGSEFDSSRGGEPLTFKVGGGQVIEGFDSAVVGMNVGEKKKQRMEAGDAYGEHQAELVFDVERSTLPPGSEVHVDDMVELGFPDGRTVPVRIAAINDESLTLDANHPLAGKALTFELELVSIE